MEHDKRLDASWNKSARACPERNCDGTMLKRPAEHTDSNRPDDKFVDYFCPVCMTADGIGNDLAKWLE